MAVQDLAAAFPEFAPVGSAIERVCVGLVKESWPLRKNPVVLIPNVAVLIKEGERMLPVVAGMLMVEKEGLGLEKSVLRLAPDKSPARVDRPWKTSARVIN